MNYQMLSLKSVRIINRLISHLASRDLEFSKFMEDIVVRQAVKTKSSNAEVEIFMAKKFFSRLHACGIKKSP